MARWVVHYGEIGIKGDNRHTFEDRLAANLRRSLGRGNARIEREYGRLVLDAPEIETGRVEERLAATPGVVRFARVSAVPLEVGAIEAEAVRLARADLQPSFRIETRRSNKRFEPGSVELNRIVGAAVQAATGMAVDLESPALTVWIEVAMKEALLYTRRHDGVGGLPVGTAGRVVALLSGGIDSPVAAFKLIRRGAEAVLVHFHNYTRDEAQVRGKLVDLAARLALYQVRSVLWLVPFQGLQEALVAAFPAGLRMVAYRRAMLRLAERIREREGALALVTGDSLGQVASQTLENLAAVYGEASSPVLTPLVGEDKTEIMALARRIGTYDISTRPYEDCCSFLVARHPETRCRAEQFTEAEARIPFDALAKDALERAERLEIGPEPGRG